MRGWEAGFCIVFTGGLQKLKYNFKYSYGCRAPRYVTGFAPNANARTNRHRMHEPGVGPAEPAPAAAEGAVSPAHMATELLRHQYPAARVPTIPPVVRDTALSSVLAPRTPDERQSSEVINSSTRY